MTHRNATQTDAAELARLHHHLAHLADDDPQRVIVADELASYANSLDVNSLVYELLKFANAMTMAMTIAAGGDEEVWPEWLNDWGSSPGADLFETIDGFDQ